MVNLINVEYVLTAALTGPSCISLLPLLGPPCSLRYNDIEIRPINNYKNASECSSKLCASFALNRELENTMFSKEGM